MTDIIFVEDNFDIEKINLNQIDLEQSKIFTLNFNAHIILKEKNIQHDIAESYISKNDRGCRVLMAIIKRAREQSR